MSGTDGPRDWFFDTWSRFYDEAVIQRFVYRPVHDAVLSELRSERPARVLDLGCGTGLLTERLRRELEIAHVTGADFSAGMLQQAARRRHDIDWVRASALALPFADSSFDAITSTEAFHWFPDQAAALRECRRVLAPGGRLLVALVNPDFELIGTVTQLLSRVAGQPFYWPTAMEMRTMLEAAGLAVDSQRRLFRLFAGLLLPPVLSVARKAVIR
ncbi:MAG TPA: methyltransferase domain-containing protein [Candidatus Limnocylindrales bacterium]|nr:methyltransferase domain-containing protein [Candidatus Limnocylindrales bacterium]